MYGLVNQAIQTMVTEAFGEEKWLAISNKSGVENVFVAMDPYPDDVTFKLVMAASEVLELDPPDVLRAFGKWWITFASKEYASLLAMAGNSFMEFITNLNDIHTRVGYMLSKLSPPSFKVNLLADNEFEVHYYSNREGLYPMVHGMIEGIAERFDVDVEVSHTVSTADGQECDIFLVSQK